MEITIHNTETGEVVTRLMNEDEIAIENKKIDENELLRTQYEKRKAAKEAIALKLGLTADDLKALGL